MTNHDPDQMHSIRRFGISKCTGKYHLMLVRKHENIYELAKARERKNTIICHVNWFFFFPQKIIFWVFNLIKCAQLLSHVMNKYVCSSYFIFKCLHCQYRLASLPLASNITAVTFYSPLVLSEIWLSVLTKLKQKNLHMSSVLASSVVSRVRFFYFDFNHLKY